MPEQACSAAVLTAYEAPLELRSFPLPDEIGAEEALVRVQMAGICGTDVHLWLGQCPSLYQSSWAMRLSATLSDSAPT